MFHSHVTVPVPQGRDFVHENFSRLIDTIHVDFGNEANFWWRRRIIFLANNLQLIESTVMLRLRGKRQIKEEQMSMFAGTTASSGFLALELQSVLERILQI